MNKPPRLGEYYVKMPQEIWDECLDLTLSEFRLLGYLLRHQRRSKNERVLITQEELLNGRKRSNGERFDRGCGLGSARHVIAARDRLIARGWLRTFKESESYNASLIYEVITRDDDEDDGSLRTPSENGDGSLRTPIQFPSDTIMVPKGHQHKGKPEEPEEVKGTPSGAGTKKPSKADERFKPLVEVLQLAWKMVNRTPDAPWGPGEAAQLSRLLKKIPNTDIEVLKQAARNWIKSATRYHRSMVHLIVNLDTFIAGPRDRFGEVISGTEPYEDRPEELESASSKARRQLAPRPPNG